VEGSDGSAGVVVGVGDEGALAFLGSSPRAANMRVNSPGPSVFFGASCCDDWIGGSALADVGARVAAGWGCGR
jgi:hypothetical protein